MLRSDNYLHHCEDSVQGRSGSRTKHFFRSPRDKDVFTHYFHGGTRDDCLQRGILGIVGEHIQGNKDYAFELFYWDYIVGVVLISLGFAFTLGSHGDTGESFLANLQATERREHRLGDDRRLHIQYRQSASGRRDCHRRAGNRFPYRHWNRGDRRRGAELRTSTEGQSGFISPGEWRWRLLQSCSMRWLTRGLAETRSRARASWST